MCMFLSPTTRIHHEHLNHGNHLVLHRLRTARRGHCDHRCGASLHRHPLGRRRLQGNLHRQGPSGQPHRVDQLPHVLHAEAARRSLQGQEGRRHGAPGPAQCRCRSAGVVMDVDTTSVSEPMMPIGIALAICFAGVVLPAMLITASIVFGACQHWNT